jgi:hypothetical protein
LKYTPGILPLTVYTITVERPVKRNITEVALIEGRGSRLKRKASSLLYPGTGGESGWKMDSGTRLTQT